MLETKGFIVAAASFLLMAAGLHSKRRNLMAVTIGSLHKKTFCLAYLFIIASFWLFGVCVMDSYDISNYRWAYDARVAHGKEPIFDIVQFMFRDASWSFDSFKAIWVTVVAILLYRGIKKYSQAPGEVAGLALITVLSGFVTQMRSALVGAIFLNAFQFILSVNKRDRILYLAIVLLSAQMHIVGYAFLIFLLVSPNTNRSFRKLYYIIIFLLTAIALFETGVASSFIYSVMNMVPFGGNSVVRVLAYFQGEGSHFRYAVFLVLKHLMLFFLADRACEIQMNNQNELDSDIIKYRMIREANILMLTFLPITIISASFERLFNCFALIQYSMVFNTGKSKFTLLNKLSWGISMQTVMIVGVLFITFIEWYFSPGDMLRILNSLEWGF